MANKILSLTDKELNALFHFLEYQVNAYCETLPDFSEVEMDILSRKLATAFKKPAQPKEAQDPDTIICYFHPKDLETMIAAVQYVFEEVLDDNSDPDEVTHTRYLVDKLQGILRQGF